LSAGGTTKGSDAESKDPENLSRAMTSQGVLPAHSVFGFQSLAIAFFLCVLLSSMFQRLCFSNFGILWQFPALLAIPPIRLIRVYPWYGLANC
jgi:hypothetical protein